MKLKNSIKIDRSIKKIAVGIGLSFLFLITGILFILKSNEIVAHTPLIFKNKLFIKSIGIIAIAFSIMTLLKGGVLIFYKKPAMLIDKTGIKNFIHYKNIGYIYWIDITEIKIQKIYSTKLLLIFVKNPEKYIQKASNKLKKQSMKTNLKLYGTPIIFSSNAFQINTNSLECILKNYHNKAVKS